MNGTLGKQKLEYAHNVIVHTGTSQEIAIQKRLLNRVLVSDKGCWLWQGATTEGYGCIRTSISKSRFTHRISYMVFNGCEIPYGKLVMHKCDVRNCINPKHLLVGTHRDNTQDAISKGRMPRMLRGPRVVVCCHGHKYEEGNIIYAKRTTGEIGRRCRQCNNDMQRKYKIRRKYKKKIALLG